MPVVHPISLPVASHPLDSICCTPPRLLSLPKARRATLADLELRQHCSIVGTCLTTGELRKLVPKHVPGIDRQRASDLDIHHAAVELCCREGAGRKDINKALDTRHALAIRQFKDATGEKALRALWQGAMANGEIPGAYWALMTHPGVTADLRALAFGDVHMLSHLVGASNRADIRRLMALERECETLKEQNERQQARLRDTHVAYAEDARRLASQVEELAAQCRRHVSPLETEGQLEGLRKALVQRDETVALHAARLAMAEQRLAASEQGSDALREALVRAESEAAESRKEAAALEQMLARQASGDGAAVALPRLDGLRLAYIGGRPSATAVMARLVAAAGGELLLHDGGVEQRSGTLGALASRADVVVFPVDCVSHNAMHVIKRTCEQSGIAWHALRSSGVASFVVLAEQLTARAQPVSHFCLRHG